MPPPVPRVVNRQQAYDLGFSRRAIDHRLATGRWHRVLPRTYLTVDTLTWRDRQAAALAFAGSPSLLSGAAGLTDRGLRSIHRPSTLLVLTPADGSIHSREWVQIRRTTRFPDAGWPVDPRCAPPARAVADAALTMHRLDDVRTLVAEAVRSQLCTVEELDVELRSGPRRDSAHLRQAIQEIGGGAWSAPEARAARLLRRARVPEFGQNKTVVLPDGRSFAVDFLWRSLRAILEIDSDTHHALTGDADWTADRHEALETAGFSVLHRTPRFIFREPDRFVSGVARWLEARAA